MDKTAIKNFSIWARNKLIADITYKAGLLGVTEEGIKDALPQSTQDAEFYDIGTKEPYAIHGEEIKQRKELVAAIKRKASQLDYKDAYRNVVEEVAYTWFNRLIAIRFMEVNDYMPAHIRVLSSDSKNKLEPDLVTTPFDAELEFTQAETEKIMQMKNDNQVDALFRFLFIKQCNALNEYLPKLFEKTSDYTELLLNVSVTDQDGIVYHLTHDINEDDFNISNIGEDGKPTGQVEIIGWMYQYYNTEPKDEAFALLKSNIKLTKERVPAATQLFTPDWIVRYMVENSLGRIWVEQNCDNSNELKEKWNYYVETEPQENSTLDEIKERAKYFENITPEQLRVIDPSMGSGHVLVYAFDVLMQIYESYGYSQRDAAKSIVENNIYGLDIDDRAFQLAYFAIMMKARSYNRRFLTLGIEPNLCSVQESNEVKYEPEIMSQLLSDKNCEICKQLLLSFCDAKEYGSVIKIETDDFEDFLREWNNAYEIALNNVVSLGYYNELNLLIPQLIKQAIIMSQKYHVVVTNPPYMGAGNMNQKLTEFVKVHYPKTKSDMSTVFMERALEMCVSYGYMSMINIPVWMFIASYEKLRTFLINDNTIYSMVHLGRGVFGSDFGTTTFVIRKNRIKGFSATYLRLFDKQGAVDSVEQKEKWFFERKNTFIAKQESFFNVPGNPIAYWVSQQFIQNFADTKVADTHFSGGRNKTHKNEIYTRLWWEVSDRERWQMYDKGGDFRRWYGNHDVVVDWSDEAKLEYDSHGGLYNQQYANKEGICWTLITSAKTAFRVKIREAHYDSGAPTIFNDSFILDKVLLGFLNSNVATAYLQLLNPTINMGNTYVLSLPYLDLDEKVIEEIEFLVNRNIELAKKDWDSFETSNDFLMHPFVEISREKDIADLCHIYEVWAEQCDSRFSEMQQNEERLNEIFAVRYGLLHEIDTSVPEKDISIRKADKEREIKSFISYAVGCMFGRWSLDEEGLVFVGNVWDETKYKTYLPEQDNIIPITDEEYFEDDIVGRFVEFVQKLYGKDVLEQNLEFIADGLGMKGNSARDTIRQYFLSEFYADHCSMYSITGSGKRPIYWQFDSGKQNGLKVLMYLHKYDANTIGNVRVDYLHRMERIYENEINRMQDTIENSSNAREVATATKRKEKLQKQLKECQSFDEKVGHLALSRIEIDLNVGVKVNYEKMQTANDGKKYQVLAKI